MHFHIYLGSHLHLRQVRVRLTRYLRAPAPVLLRPGPALTLPCIAAALPAARPDLLSRLRAIARRQGYGGGNHLLPVRAPPPAAGLRSLDAPALAPHLTLAQAPRLDVDLRSLVHDEVLLARPWC